jgi:hypothetical protein
MIVVVMMPKEPRETWTDERLDDLNKKVDRGFADTKAEIADTKAEMREGFARLHADIRAVNRNMVAGLVAIVAALIGSNAF